MLPPLLVSVKIALMSWCVVAVTTDSAVDSVTVGYEGHFGRHSTMSASLRIQRRTTFSFTMYRMMQTMRPDNNLIIVISKMEAQFVLARQISECGKMSAVHPFGDLACPSLLTEIAKSHHTPEKVLQWKRVPCN